MDRLNSKLIGMLCITEPVLPRNHNFMQQFLFRSQNFLPLSDSVGQRLVNS